MVEKKEGATMTCANCSSNLTCHEKRYPASENFPEKVVMQWQNGDGSAHYSTKDGKNFNCNIPEEQEGSQQQQTFNSNTSTITLDSLHEELQTVKGILQSILHIVVDLKTQQNMEDEDSLE